MIRRCILVAAAGTLLASHAVAQAAPAAPYNLSVAVMPSRSEAYSHEASARKVKACSDGANADRYLSSSDGAPL